MIARAEASPPEADSFRGDLRAIPFARIVEFCEAQGLTGEVEVAAEGFRAVIPFRGGEVADHAEGEAISRAFELSGGTFEIRVRPVDFAALRAAAGEPTPPDAAWRPPGRLSAVMVGERLVQLQTEYVTTPSPLVVSVGLRDGRTILKRSARAAGSREAITRLVEGQHAAVEREVRQKLAELAAARAGETPPPASAASAGAAGFGALFERGLNAFLAGDLPGALAAWEQASALDPTHATLQVNLGVVRRKLAKG